MPVEGQVMGVDIGGSGIKAAVVDVGRGKLITERVRLKTPQPATPEAVIDTVVDIQRRLAWKGDVGCGFPGSIRRGVVTLAPNLHPSWRGFALADGLKARLHRDSVAVLNDADAAGLAEIEFGAGRGKPGTVVVITLGTGIGTAVFHDGVLLPSTELGHVELEGKDAELLAADSARARNEWGWKRWSGHVDRYLAHLEYLLAVDLFIISGGVSKKPQKFLPYLRRVQCPVVPARMGNLAGIVGAARFAVQSADG